MSNFLPAGIISDTVEQIIFKADELVQAMAEEEKGEGLPDWRDKAAEIEEIAFGLSIFLEKLSCQPLIYTGPGTTEEVVRRLDWALAFTDEFETIEMIKPKKNK